MKYRFVMLLGLLFVVCAQQEANCQEKSTRKWIKKLSSKDQQVRSKAIDALGKIGGPAVPAVGEALRKEIAVFLSELKELANGAESIDNIGGALSTIFKSRKFLIHQSLAAQARVKISQPAIPEAIALLQDEEQIVRELGAKILGAIGVFSDDVLSALTHLFLIDYLRICVSAIAQSGDC